VHHLNLCHWIGLAMLNGLFSSLLRLWSGWMRGFVMHSYGCQGLHAQIGQFIGDLIVPEDDEATCLALQGVSNKVDIAASVAVLRRHIQRVPRITHEESASPPRNSCATSSALSIVDAMTVSHAPVSLPAERCP
jgi:hypothetical protein